MQTAASQKEVSGLFPPDVLLHNRLFAFFPPVQSSWETLVFFLSNKNM